MIEIIPLKDCKDRYLYKIHSRNLYFGVFDQKNNDFIGIRTKCGEKFLDRENYHIGCVKVLEEKKKIPENILLETGHFSETEKSVWGGKKWIENEELFKYLQNIK